MAEISIIIYSSILSLILFFCIKKYKAINATVTVFALYTISSLASIYFFYNSNYDYKNITLTPIIYVIVCLLLTIRPIINYDNINNKHLTTTHKGLRLIKISIILISILAIEPFIEMILHLPSIITNQNILAEIYEAKADGTGAKYNFLSWIGRKLYWINYLIRDIIPILLFFYITKFHKLNKKLIVGLIIAIINPILFDFSLGGRSSVISSFFYLIFTYSVFRNFITPQIIKRIDKAIILLVSIIVLLLTIVTTIRFKSSDLEIDLLTWICLYTGEGVLNFSADLWSVDATSNGDNTFLMLRYFMGLTENIDIESIRATRDVLNVRNLVFYTYIGTIYYDFNKIGTLIFILIFSCTFTFLTSAPKARYNFMHIFFICVIGKIAMMGVMFYPYTLWNDQLSLLLTTIFTVIIYIKERT